MPTGSAMARATPIENTVSMSVVGIRSSRRAEADWPWWKNDLPKLPVTAWPTKRANWTGSGSCRPSVRRRTARSASGASGMMRATGSPLACRIANVTSETPTITTSTRASRRTTNAVTSVGSAFWPGVEEPEPLVAAGGVFHALADRQRVVLGEEEHRRRFIADHLLDLGVGPPALLLVERRPPLVDQLVEAFHARVPLADPAADLAVEQRVQHGIGVEDRVVAPGDVDAVRGLAVRLVELVPGRARVPQARVRSDADLGQHLRHRLVLRADR